MVDHSLWSLTSFHLLNHEAILDKHFGHLLSALGLISRKNLQFSAKTSYQATIEFQPQSPNGDMSICPSRCVDFVDVWFVSWYSRRSRTLIVFNRLSTISKAFITASLQVRKLATAKNKEAMAPVPVRLLEKLVKSRLPDAIWRAELDCSHY